MACNCGTLQDFLKIEKRLSVSSVSSLDAEQKSTKIKLNKGGWIIQTQSAGNIQYGMPPETLKDCFVQGINIPTHYIVPQNQFDKKFCMTFCEFEFPAYYNFFVKKTKINLICTKQEEQRIRTIFQETLLGPLNFDEFQDDFDDDYNIKNIPDIQKELQSFAKNPFNPQEPLTLDLLLNFTNYDDQGRAYVNDTVYVTKKEKKVYIYENNELIGKGKDKPCIKLEEDQQKEFSKFGIFNNPNINEDFQGSLQEIYIESNFQPPAFGVTILGCSHGFDPTGTTSGYILWINGRGIMIDPPAFSTIKLKQMGIPLSLIGWVFISHCHADHDSGAFQQILSNQKIEIITTKTVMNSFLRKYSAVTGMDISTIKRLFTFRQALVGAPCIINGASFNVYYSLHSIPCLGFICQFQGKSIYFSGDTFYDPENMKKRFIDTGIMSQERFQELTDFDTKFNHDLILHEAGVPPIHTPMQILVDLPSNVKKNLLLVHVSKKDIPENSGLVPAKIGIENTYTILGQSFYKQNPEQIILNRLTLLSSIPIFQNAKMKHIRDLVNSLQEVQYYPGDYIVKEGEIGNYFYIVESGVCKISSNSNEKQFKIYYYNDDYFGESALQKQQKRMATVQAVTECKLLKLKRNDFLFIFSEDTEVQCNLNKLLASRQKLSLIYLQRNVFLSQMSSSQRIQFEMILQYKQFKKGQQIWKEGEICTQALYTIEEGLKLEYYDKELYQKIQNNVQKGLLIADINNIFNKSKYSNSLICTEDTAGFYIDANDLINFLQNNPGFYMYAINKFIIK